MGWLWLVTAGATALILAVAESIRERRSFKITRYSLQTSKAAHGTPPKKLVFLSDLHNREYGEKNRLLLQSIENEKPDLILIGGDMLIGKAGIAPEKALEFVSRLPRIAPVYYACGNHEQRMKKETERYGEVFFHYKKRLEACGVHFLENESEVVSLGGFPIRVTGLELPMETYKKFKKSHVTKNTVSKQVGACASEEYQILLAHNPTYYPAYKEWGADLVLSGHLHGGLVRIPGWRGVITPQAFLFPKYSGEMTEENGRVIIVSRGLGTHTIHLRIFNKPELIAIRITGS